MIARLREYVARLAGTLHGEDPEETEEELEFHIDMATARNVSRGMSSEAARRDALLKFGGMDRTHESLRDVQRSRVIEDAWWDVRHTLRGLLREKGFACAAILTLALGIGANAAIFSILESVLLRPLPYAAPEELVAFDPSRYDNYVSWTESSEALASHGAFTTSLANVSGGAEPVRVWTLAVTASLLPTLGVEPVIGRNFTSEDDAPGAPPRVLLRYGFWRSVFNGDETLVGRTVLLNGQPHEVIGVLPETLEFPPPARRADGSLPRVGDVWKGVGSLDDLHERGGFTVIARLAPGATLDRASAEVNQRARAGGVDAVAVESVAESVTRPLRPAVLMFTAAVGFVLLIACANLGSLLLVRLAGREREFGLRIALGAPRGRLVRQILTEGAVLAILGAAAGLAVAVGLVDALVAMSPPELQLIRYASLSPRVLVFTTVVAFATALLIGLGPVLRVLRRDPRDGMSSSRGGTLTRRTGRGHSVLVVAEVAFAVVLLVGGSLFLRSFAKLTSVDPGFEGEGLVTADLFVTNDRYETLADVLRFFDRVEERLLSSPGVASVSGIDRLPYGPSYSRIPLGFTDGRTTQPDAPPMAANVAVLPGYFETMGIPVVSGREFTAADAIDAPRVAVISRALAEEQWPGQNPVRQRIVVFGEVREIIGVAGDVRHLGPTMPAEKIVYLPQSQDYARRFMTLVVRGNGSAAQLTSLVREQIRAEDPQLPISNLRSFTALRSERTAGARFNSLVIGSFATLATLLAAVGIYGVLSWVVAQRRREIGLRMALGASRSSVMQLHLRQALVMAAIGATVGIALALPLVSLARTLLFGIAPTDTRAWTAAILLALLVAVLSAWLPAWRASKIEPGIVLAGE